jgi:hypothetical protein
MNSKSFKAMVAFAALLAVITGGVLLGSKVFGGSISEKKPVETAMKEPTTPSPARETEDKPVPPPELAPQPKADAPAAPKPQQEVSTQAMTGLNDIRAMITAGKTFEAREALWKLYTDEKAGPALRNDIEVEMTKLADLMFVKKPAERDFEFYTVQGGDTLIKIAAYFRTEKKMTVEFGTIKLFSGLNRDLINVGMRLKVPKEKISIVVRKSTFKVNVMYQGLVVKSFRCGLGKNDGTPCAKFTVGTKTASPTWYPPESSGLKGPIPPNDPRNALGSHWIGLDNDTHRGLGIHGTIEPDSIGKNSSLGCVRMLNEEVKQVFELVSPGTEVLIIE